MNSLFVFFRKMLPIACFVFSILNSNARQIDRDTAIAKHQPVLKIGRQSPDLMIKQKVEKTFVVALKKDIYYSFIVQQKGIDLIIALKNKNGKLITKMDSPNGRFGPEKIAFSPDSSASFILTVMALNDTSNAKEGKFAVLIKPFPKTLKKYSYKQLNRDFDILKNGFIETRVGLWYNTYAQFDSLCAVQKAKIKDKMNGLEFYRILAPIVTYTKEGHCAVRPSEEVNSYLVQQGKYFPFVIKILEGKVYICNNLRGFKTKGMMISEINGESIDQLMQIFLNIEPSDGYNLTSKYHWIETAFSKYYNRLFPSPESFDLELINPKSGQQIHYNKIPSYNFKDLQKLYFAIIPSIPNYRFREASNFTLDSTTNTAILTINSFSAGSYKDGVKGFQKFLANTFKTIDSLKIKHLIIDIRRNEGGRQGMEDHLLSYLINKPYLKYKYVEIPAFNYSFLQYSDDKDNEVSNDLLADFYHNSDGRYLNIPGHYQGDTPKPTSFEDDIYILISGLTFSGGSEFAALAKNHTNAHFIGEETGGGYYGNTSGTFINYTLPNTAITGRIPLCKFVVQEKDNTVPLGHGLPPDYYFQPTIEEYLNGYDAEMEYAKKLIKQPYSRRN